MEKKYVIFWPLCQYCLGCHYALTNMVNDKSYQLDMIICDIKNINECPYKDKMENKDD